jgi:hypothetical protein
MLAMNVATSNENVSCAHLPMFRHKALIDSVPQETLEQIQHLAYLQNRIDALFSATAYR